MVVIELLWLYLMEIVIKQYKLIATSLLFGKPETAGARNLFRLAEEMKLIYWFLWLSSPKVDCIQTHENPGVPKISLGLQPRVTNHSDYCGTLKVPHLGKPLSFGKTGIFGHHSPLFISLCWLLVLLSSKLIAKMITGSSWLAQLLLLVTQKRKGTCILIIPTTSWGSLWFVSIALNDLSKSITGLEGSGT